MNWEVVGYSFVFTEAGTDGLIAIALILASCAEDLECAWQGRAHL